MAATVATHPFDVVKTRVQTSAKMDQSSWQLAQDMVHRGGGGVLFRGMGMRMLSVVPGCSIMVTTYELVKRWSKEGLL
eukprot:9271040-Pyramimonas_sp.AAC.1